MQEGLSPKYRIFIFISNSKISNYLYILTNTWQLPLCVQTIIIWMYLSKRL